MSRKPKRKALIIGISDYTDTRLYLFPISEFQITQTSLRNFEVLVQQKIIFNNNEDDLLENIKKYIQISLSFQVDISAKITSFNYNSKFERYRTLVY
jgi:hypothetical protein